jgi:hypothetical protein
MRAQKYHIENLFSNKFPVFLLNLQSDKVFRKMFYTNGSANTLISDDSLPKFFVS